MRSLSLTVRCIQLAPPPPKYLPRVIVNGIGWLQDRELARWHVGLGADQGVQEADMGTGIFSSLEPTAPTDIRIAPKQQSTCRLERTGLAIKG